MVQAATDRVYDALVADSAFAPPARYTDWSRCVEGCKDDQRGKEGEGRRRTVYGVYSEVISVVSYVQILAFGVAALRK